MYLALVNQALLAGFEAGRVARAWPDVAAGWRPGGAPSGMLPTVVLGRLPAALSYPVSHPLCKQPMQQARCTMSLVPSVKLLSAWVY